MNEAQVGEVLTEFLETYGNGQDWSPDQLATCIGMDALRLCRGLPSRNFNAEAVMVWLSLLSERAGGDNAQL